MIDIPVGNYCNGPEQVVHMIYTVKGVQSLFSCHVTDYY